MMQSVSSPVRPIIFGEVLFDRFPDGSAVLGGAPFNVAWHLRGLGENPLFVSRVGDDPDGEAVRTAMAAWRMDLSGLETDSGHPTGVVRIELQEGEPCYAILPDQAYDFVSLDGDSLNLERPAFLYHGSLALRQGRSRRTLEILAERLKCPIFMDVNLRAPWWQLEEIFGWVVRANWLKLNADELAILVPGEDAMESKARRLMEKAGLDYLVLTRGSEGAVAFGAERVRASTGPVLPTPVVDTVGAGDAFSAVFLYGRLKNWPLGLSLERAQAFASGVVGLRGATVADPAFYQAFLDSWAA